jgi:deoxyribodipyrimidine photo-lyase
MTKNLIWFRQDLRISDNPALYEACKNSNNLTAIYIHDEESEGTRLLGGASKYWLHHALLDLQTSLEKLGVKLIFKKGKSEEILEKICTKNDISKIFWNRLYEPYHIARDKKIKENFKQKGIEIESFNASLLVEPWSVQNKQGGYFKVFTPFYKTCLAEHKVEPILPKIEPKNLASIDEKSDDLNSYNFLPTKPNWAKNFNWKISEEAAIDELHEFMGKAVSNYGHARDFANIEGTSKLSAYLHFGQISVRYIFNTAELYRERGFSSKDIDKFIAEIYWREFSYNLLYNFPELNHKNFRAQFDNFPWQNNEKYIAAWQKGLTGYPIVDAGIRQLWQTGWMHNRVRMIVASFLTKHLLTHWKVGEEWFWDTLVDADLASNSASWQWVAGSGADAAPYFRIFNPILQGKKFDPDGDYVRKYIPELKNMPKEFIHNPWEAPLWLLEKAGVTLGKSYPAPIVKHEEARQKALQSYKGVQNIQ